MDADILTTAEEILGPAVRVERHREWATFWCPFHNDADRAGQGGHPNFGVHLSKGYWKCLRCGASGGSLKSLSYKLGKGWQPPVSAMLPTHSERPPTQVERLDEAMAEARANVQRSPAWGYLAQTRPAPLHFPDVRPGIRPAGPGRTQERHRGSQPVPDAAAGWHVAVGGRRGVCRSADTPNRPERALHPRGAIAFGERAISSRKRITRAGAGG